MSSDSKYTLKPDLNGQYNCPDPKDISNYQVIEVTGDNAFEDEKVISFLNDVSEAGQSKNIELHYQGGLKRFNEDFVETISKFNKIVAIIEINDVFDRYDIIYKDWDDLIENLSLLSLAVHPTEDPIITMKCNINALNAVYIDQILRFFYTDLMQLFPYIETKLSIGFSAFPKYLDIKSMPGDYKKLAKEHLEHYLSTDDEGLTQKDIAQFEETKRILDSSEFNAEHYRLVTADIKRFGKLTKNPQEFERLVSYALNRAEKNEKFEDFIDLLPDDMAFEKFKKSGQLNILSKKKPNNLKLRMRIFQYHLDIGEYKIIESDLREMASKQQTTAIYPKALKLYINEKKAQKRLKDVIPFAMNLYDIEPSEKNAENLALAFLESEDFSAVNYFVYLILKHNPQSSLANEIKRDLEANGKIETNNFGQESFINSEDEKEPFDYNTIKNTLKSCTDNQLSLSIEKYHKQWDSLRVTEVVKSFGWDLMEAGDNKKAELVFEILSKLSNDFDVFKTLGDIHSMNSRPQKAIENYEKALREKPHDTYVLKQFAWRHYDIQQPGVGKEIFSKVLKIDPNDEDAKKEVSLS